MVNTANQVTSILQKKILVVLCKLFVLCYILYDDINLELKKAKI